MEQTPYPELVRILVAALIGLLIGLDRERAAARKSQKVFAGVRTFPLIALAGALPALLQGELGNAPLIVSFLAVAAVTIIAYLRTSASNSGATTEIAALATFLLGALAGTGQILIAGATGVAVAVLLVAKPPLERFSKRITMEELSAALELAVVAVIVLPLIPNHGYGPWGVLNPFSIWTVVVIVHALSFGGFVAMRLFGEGRGTLLAGAIGGIVSSTAVTVSMARAAGASARGGMMAAAAATLASAIMCLRITVLIGLINLEILPRLLPALAIMAVEGFVAAFWLRKRAGAERNGAHPKLANPSSLKTAVTFAALYAAVLLIVRAAREYLGSAGTYAAAAISGLADVDAIVIALAKIGAQQGDGSRVALAIALAIVSNTFAKLVYAWVIGTGPFRVYIGITLGLMGLLGGVTAAAVSWL